MVRELVVGGGATKGVRPAASGSHCRAWPRSPIAPCPCSDTRTAPATLTRPIARAATRAVTTTGAASTIGSAAADRPEVGTAGEATAMHRAALTDHAEQATRSGGHLMIVITSGDSFDVPNPARIGSRCFTLPTRAVSMVG
jgi:hypothetical protein